MNRRRFLYCAAGGVLIPQIESRVRAQHPTRGHARSGYSTDLVIVGGGLGGCAAALAALRNGLQVVMTEPTDWIGGQLTQQAVPPDEHRWIESAGCTRTYRQLRHDIREFYRRIYPLTPEAKRRDSLNPGDGLVSRLCHEPRVALAVLQSWFSPFLSSRKLILLLEHVPINATVAHDRVRSVQVRNLNSGHELTLEAPVFIDATELGDLLPLTGTEFVTGAESQNETGEPHAAQTADPANQQAFTCCFAVDYLPGENHVIDRPKEYDFWRNYSPRLRPPWPGRLLDFVYTHPPTGQPRELGFNPERETPGKVNLWQYRRIAAKRNFENDSYPSDISLINWPQNDYFLGNLVGAPAEEAKRHIERAKQLSLSLLYWLQTEAPRDDGKQGYPGLRLRPDIVDTVDGLAKFPYVREARRIRAMFTVLEQHVARKTRAELTGVPEAEAKAAPFHDSVGVGSYPIDLHPSTAGDNYIDFATVPFQIPLGALLPVRVKNLLPASKNIGVTHVTNGCYRLHPVEWNIGEAAGLLAAFASRRKLEFQHVRETEKRLTEFQSYIHNHGVETHWK